MENFEMTRTNHLAQASSNCIAVLRQWMVDNPKVPRAALIEDVVGTLSVAIWDCTDLSPGELLASPEIGGRFWSGRILNITSDNASPFANHTGGLGEELMNYAQPVQGTSGRLWVAHRFRSRGHWFSKPQSPPWALKDGPGIIVFYSYKGGTGRSTTLASMAIQLAQTGSRLVLVDADLDAPGIASSFLPEGSGAIENGVVDYLLDSMTANNLDPTPYSWVCRRQELSGDGEIIVIPAGKLDAHYPARLARLSFDPEPGSSQEAFIGLLQQSRSVFNPDWILVDARTGFTDMAAMSLAGLGHLHVLCGTGSKQTWQGLNIVVEHLGRQRLQLKMPQADCLLVHTMVPREEVGNALHEAFVESAWDCFSENYYADDVDAQTMGLFDVAWTIGDAEQNSNAPHQPFLVRYDSGLAAYSDLALVADRLTHEPGLVSLNKRIQEWLNEQRLPTSGDAL